MWIGASAETSATTAASSSGVTARRLCGATPSVTPCALASRASDATRRANESMDVHEAALRRGGRRSPESAVRVEHRQQRQRDAGVRCRGDHAPRELRGIRVRAARGIVMHVVKFGDRRIARLQHLDVRLRGDRLERVGVDAVEKRVHRLPPRPETVAVGAGPAGAPGERALERVRVQVRHAGNERSARALGAVRRRVCARHRRCSRRRRCRSARRRPIRRAATRRAQTASRHGLDHRDQRHRARRYRIDRERAGRRVRPRPRTRRCRRAQRQPADGRGRDIRPPLPVAWQTRQRAGAMRAAASRTTTTLPCARPRRSIRLKSRTGPVDERARDLVVAAERIRLVRRAQFGGVGIGAEAHSRARRAARERGPRPGSARTGRRRRRRRRSRASRSRRASSPPDATTISVVWPPPFFHGIRT